MEGIVVIAVLCLVFTLYALPAGITSITQDDFFLMNRSAAVKQYNDTTVAYSLQVAVTVYFFYWGFEYGLSNIFFIATWFLGLLAFGLCAPQLANFVCRREFDGSLFSIISGGKPVLRIVMGLLFIVSLVGLLFTEIYMTAGFIDSVAKARLISVANSHFYFWIGFSFLAFVVLWYCSLGGIRKVVATDTWQLSIAYVGASLFIATLSPSINRHAGTHAVTFVSLGMASLFTVMAFIPGAVSYLTQRNEGYNRSTTSYTTRLALIASAVISVLPVLLLAPNHLSTLVNFPKPFGSMLMVPFGWAPIVGFTLINLVWQFSDYTAYHRLALLDLPIENRKKTLKIRESIFVTMLNSPLTWGLGIFAGMAVDASGLLPATSTDVFNDFVLKAASLANGGDQFLRWSLIGLSAFLGSVMLSTVDSGFMSVALIIVRDITKRDLSPVARFIVNLAVIGVMAGFADLLVEFNVNVLVFLNATYAWGLIFGAISLAAIFDRRIPTGWAYLSLLLGAGIGSIETFNPTKLPDLVILVAPSVSAILLSGLTVCLSLILCRRRTFDPPQSR